MHTTSPDRAFVANLGENCTIELTNSTGKKQPNHLEGHEDAILHLAFSPDSWFLASASADQTVRLWETHTGAAARENMATHLLEGHEGPVTHLAFVPSREDLLVTGSADHTARLWNFKSGELLQTFAGHTGAVFHVSISPDGANVTTSSHDGTERLWNLETGKVIRKFASAHALEPQTVSKGSRPDTVALLTRHQSAIIDLAFSPNGLILASMSQDSVRLWHGKSGQFIKSLSTEAIEDEVPASRLVFSPDSSLLAIQTTARTQELWDLEKGQRLFRAAGQWPTFFPVGQRLVSGVPKDDGSYDCRIWDIAQSQELAKLRLPNAAGKIFGMASSIDCETITFVFINKNIDGYQSGPGVIRTWNWCSGQETENPYWVNMGFNQRLSHTLISPRTNWAIEIPVSEDPNQNQLRRGPFSEAPTPIDLKRGAAYWYKHERDTLPPPVTQHWVESTKRLASCVFSPTSSVLATAASLNHVSLWDLESGQELQQLRSEKNNERFSDVAFSPDGNLVAAGSAQSDTATLWRTRTGGSVHIYTGNRASITRVCFSPGGEHLVCGCKDGSIHIWPVPSHGKSI